MPIETFGHATEGLQLLSWDSEEPVKNTAEWFFFKRNQKAKWLFSGCFSFLYATRFHPWGLHTPRSARQALLQQKPRKNTGQKLLSHASLLIYHYIISLKWIANLNSWHEHKTNPTPFIKAASRGTGSAGTSSTQHICVLTFFVPWFFLKNLNPSSGWAGLMIVKVKAVHTFKLAESNTISLQH